jgi:hypothetical protein
MYNNIMFQNICSTDCKTTPNLQNVIINIIKGLNYLYSYYMDYIMQKYDNFTLYQTNYNATLYQ